MSARRNNANRIRGPQSALTDFLAANNISAADIRNNYEQRLRRNDAANAQAAPSDQQPDDADNDAQPEQEEEEEEIVQPSSSKKRKRMTEKAKKLAKKRARIADSDESDDDYDITSDMYSRPKPRPGQLENCELCSKRFTVTPYSKTGPDGGLLCTPCGKVQTTNDKKAERAKNSKAGTGQKRRKTESNRLDGLVNPGPKSLQQLCVEKAVKHVGDIDELGELPDNLLGRLSEIFSKKRVLDSRTLDFFLQPGLKRIAINDAARLELDDFTRIFKTVPFVRQVILDNACQFKDEAVDFMIDKAPHVDHIHIYAANLVSNDAWMRLFTAYGSQLKTVKLEWLDAAFTDEVVEVMVQNCPNIARLKLKYCRKLTANSLLSIAKLDHLEHLSLQVSSPVSAEETADLLKTLGPELRTLSLEGFTDTDDMVIDTVRACKRLSKFRISGIDCVSDAALASIFSLDPNETSVPGLYEVDLSSARDVDNNNPGGPEDDPIGLCSTSFQALMAHSGSKLRKLDIASCRHISHAAFCDVFNSKQHSYPHLTELNISFCNSVDTSVIRAIFASCPNLRKLIAFGCFKIDHVIVPAGIALIGVPNAQDAIEQYGRADVDVDKALGMMDQLSGAGSVAVGA